MSANLEKLSNGHRTRKGQFSCQSQRKAMPRSVQTAAQMHSSHTLESNAKNKPDILECKVKWALGSISTIKASGGDGIPAELF